MYIGYVLSCYHKERNLHILAAARIPNDKTIELDRSLWEFKCINQVSIVGLQLDLDFSYIIELLINAISTRVDLIIQTPN